MKIIIQKLQLSIFLVCIVLLFASQLQSESKVFPPPCVMGDEGIMKQKAHGEVIILSTFTDNLISSLDEFIGRFLCH